MCVYVYFINTFSFCFFSLKESVAQKKFLLKKESLAQKNLFVEK